MLEIDCRKCENCTGNACKLYGENPNAAVSDCAKDEFENYRRKPERGAESDG